MVGPKTTRVLFLKVNLYCSHPGGRRVATIQLRNKEIGLDLRKDVGINWPVVFDCLISTTGVRYGTIAYYILRCGMNVASEHRANGSLLGQPEHPHLPPGAPVLVVTPNDSHTHTHTHTNLHCPLKTTPFSHNNKSLLVIG